MGFSMRFGRFGARNSTPWHTHHNTCVKTIVTTKQQTSNYLPQVATVAPSPWNTRQKDLKFSELNFGSIWSVKIRRPLDCVFAFKSLFIFTHLYRIYPFLTRVADFLVTSSLWKNLNETILKVVFQGIRDNSRTRNNRTAQTNRICEL